jgi:hypothetical protein
MRQTKTGGRLRRLGARLATAVCLLAEPGMGQPPPPPPQPAGSGPAQAMTLDDCLRTAMEGNHRRRASKFAVVTVETIRAIVAQLEKNEAMAQAALANTMGLPWTAAIQPADRELVYAPFAENLDRLVSSAYQLKLNQ